MRQTFVAGNWKMNGTLKSTSELIDGIKAGMANVGDTQVVVCPTFVHIASVAEQIAGSDIALGAQNVCTEDSGAFTGEISGSMLSEFGCSYVIIGHSERRSIYGETDELIAEKYEKVLKDGMTPILCVGELLEERESGKTEDVVARQLDAVIDRVGIDAIAKGVIAYEPVWAIGTGKVASPEQAQDVHAFIRGRLASKSAAVAEKVQILYGGSVKGDNAQGLFAKPDIDGGLIGGAALNADDFLAICRAG